MKRRLFLSYVGIAAAGGIVGTISVPFLKNRKDMLRPPGAINENRFLAACIKCGLCVQICPVKAIHLADITEGLSAGTAFIDSRHSACDFSCVGIQCVLVCPSGALIHEKAQNAEMVRIGLAVLKPNICLSVNNKLYTGSTPHNYNTEDYKWKVHPDSYRKELCRLCADECPIGPGAIDIEGKKDTKTGKTYQTPIVHAGCTGCGVCEMVCPVNPAAIVIIPRKKWSSENV